MLQLEPDDLMKSETIRENVSERWALTEFSFVKKLKMALNIFPTVDNDKIV